ncbi:MAG TPA: efflux RND transporter periplasmic adaptor subunit [Thermoanaerobaculia bacterium]|nr:efflux RND transporter periplasmic adaptor subunit [Thermoanaerobaculia bacterium]
MTLPRKLALLLLLLLPLLAPACRREPGHEDDHDEHAHADHAEAASTGPGAERRVHLDDLRGVAFTVVGEPREEGAWFAAEAVADPASSASFAAPVAGTVAEVRVELGQTVQPGQALVELQSPELADLKARWLSARARRQRAETELAREQRLLAAAATSQREVEAAGSELAQAETEEAAARLALEARGVAPEQAGARLTVRAPRGGMVASLAVVLGQGVAASQELGRLLAPGTDRVQVELPLPGPEDWRAGVATEVRHADGRRWPAQVEGVPPALSNETRRLTYRLRLTGGTLPLAGTPLEARVPLARAIVVPQTALQQIEGVWGVFVKEGDEALFRPVRKGAELGSEVLVLAGLATGEEVATEGAYLLKSLHLKQAGGGDDHGH